MAFFEMKRILPNDDEKTVAHKNRFNEGFRDGARSFMEGLPMVLGSDQEKILGRAYSLGFEDGWTHAWMIKNNDD